MAKKTKPKPRTMQKHPKIARCKRMTCMYHMPAGAEFGCNYAGITGHTRAAQLPEDMRSPEKCPLYSRGKRQGALMDPLFMPGSRAQTEPARAQRRGKMDWDKALECYKAGMTDNEIMAVIGCAESTVCTWRRKNHLPPNKKGGK